MAITTYRTFIRNLGDLTIDDVVTKFTYIPPQVPASDLPASFVRVPSGEEAPLTAQTHGGWPTLRAELVVLVSPTELDTHESNYWDAVDMLDNVSEAFRGDTVGNLGKGPVRFDCFLVADYQIGSTYYWAVVTEVEAYG